jgi:hypothetical protein
MTPDLIREATARAVAQGAETYWSGGVERIEFTAEGFATWYAAERERLADEIAQRIESCIVVSRRGRRLRAWFASIARETGRTAR